MHLQAHSHNLGSPFKSQTSELNIPVFKLFPLHSLFVRQSRVCISTFKIKQYFCPSARVHSNKINPGLGLPIQSSNQTSTQKSTAQTRTKSRTTKPRSPSRGSIGASSLLGTIKTKSPVKVPKQSSQFKLNSVLFQLD